MRYKWISVLLMMIALSACNPLDILPKPSGLSVDTEITAGDKNQKAEISGKKEETHNTADTINQTYTTVQKGKTWWDIYFTAIVALFIGWITRTPFNLYQDIKGIFKRNSDGR